MVTAVQYENLKSALQPFNAMIWNDYKAALAA